MKIQDQVCTLEQAKKLKEFGVSQKAIFKYNQNLYDIEKEGDINEGVWTIWYNGIPCFENQYSAFTVAELGLIIGLIIETKNTDIPDEITEKHAKGEDSYHVLYDPKLLADILIYWLENKLITSDEANEILK